MKALRVTPDERKHVLERDRYQCVRCGHRDPTGKTLQVDHVRDKARHGPAMDLSEYQTLCAFGKGQGGCHREKTAREAAERAAERRTGMTKTKTAPARSRRPAIARQVIGYTFCLALLAGAVLFCLSWGADQGIVDRSYYETGMRIARVSVIVVVVLTVTLGTAAMWAVVRRARRSAGDAALNATLAPVYGYSTGVRAVRVHKRDRSGPVEWTVMYPATNADEAPGWAAEKTAKTAGRVGFPVKTVTLDVLNDMHRVRKLRTGETPDAAETANGAPDVDARMHRQAELAEGVGAELGVKGKELARIRVTVVAWSADLDVHGRPVPADWTLTFPPSVPAQDLGVRLKALDKVMDLMRGVRWGADWGRPGQVRFRDLGPDPLNIAISLPAMGDPHEAAKDPAAWMSRCWLGLRDNPAGLADWVLRLWQNHILIAGATGAGKGSIIWNIVRWVLPLKVAGLAELVGLDPKGGMELGKGQELFDVYEQDTDQMVSRLKDEVEFMKKRQAQLTAAGIRLNHGTRRWKLRVIIVDELAYLSAYLDPKAQNEARRYLSILLTQGRAVGVIVVGAVQDPSKETVPLRQLFPWRLGLRLDEMNQVTMALGDQARKRGALCDRISALMQGTAYAYVEDSHDPANGTVARGRAGWVNDAEIDRMKAWYAEQVTAWQQAEDQAAAVALAQAATEPERVRAKDLAEGKRYVFEEGPGVVVGVEEARPGRTAIDYHLDSGEIAGIEVDDGDEFDRA